MSDSNGKPGVGQVAKPSPDFPLTPHAGARQWCKKIKGKIHYFGSLSDPEAARDRYLYERDYLLAGRTPPPRNTGGLTIQDMVNEFLTSKKRRMDSGELQPRSFMDYYDACGLLVSYFGKSAVVENLTPKSFAGFRDYLAKGKSLVTLRNRISKIMTAFRWAEDNKLASKVFFGTEFKPPSAKALRMERSRKPVRLFAAGEIRTLLDRAPTCHLRTMVLLGINCALGNSDVGEMEIRHADLDAGWLVYPRVKTGIERRAKLWAETMLALREVLAKRKQPRDAADSNILFLTKKRNQRYITLTGDVTRGKAVVKNNITAEFSRLLGNVGINRSGTGFYSLRHTFRTMADNLVGDQRAIDMVMGHKRGDISEEYTHIVTDERLERVANAVHDWLFPPKKAEASHG